MRRLEFSALQDLFNKKTDEGQQDRLIYFKNIGLLGISITYDFSIILGISVKGRANVSSILSIFPIVSTVYPVYDILLMVNLRHKNKFA
jgi:hypothetical protein